MKYSVLLVVAVLAVGAVKGYAVGREEGGRAMLKNLLRELAEEMEEEKAEQENMEMRGDENEADIEEEDYLEIRTKKDPRVEDLGCWKDTASRAIPTLEGIASNLDGNSWERQNRFEKCYQAARERGYEVFALQHGGWCASSPDAQNTYRKYGKSSACKADGEGGPWANQVYRIIPTECTTTPADVVIMVDSSEKVGYKDFKTEKVAVGKLIDKFTLGAAAKSGTQVGLVNFAGKAEVVANLNTHKTKTSLKKAVFNMKFFESSTAMGKALAASEKVLFGKGARKVTKVAIILTVGKANSPTAAQKSAAALRKRGVKVFAIGIGKKCDRSELVKIVGGNSKKLKGAKTFKDLVGISGNISNMVCKEVEKAVKSGKCK